MNNLTLGLIVKMAGGYEYVWKSVHWLDFLYQLNNGKWYLQMGGTIGRFRINKNKIGTMNMRRKKQPV